MRKVIALTALACSALLVSETDVTCTTEDPVVWTNPVHATANGNTLTKDSTSATGGARSSQSIDEAQGDGFVEWTMIETDTNRAAGLNNGSPTNTLEEIDFTIRTNVGIAAVYENGTWLAQTTFVSGDVFRVEILDGDVLYRKNGVTFHTSTAPTINYPLFVDTALYSENSTIANAIIGGEPTDHEPPGMTPHANWGFDQDPPLGSQPIPNSDGWNVVANAGFGSAGGWVQRVTDSTAPWSPSNIFDFVYPQGMIEGNAPATIWTAFSPRADEVYARFWWKPSDPFDVGPNGNKVAFIFNGGGDQGGQQFMMLVPGHELRVQLEYPGNVSWRMNNVNATVVTLGHWHKVEWYANRDTGELRWWLDGLLQGFHMDAPNSFTFDEFKFSPTFGGNTGAQKQQTDHYWFDHVYLSRR